VSKLSEDLWVRLVDGTLGLEPLAEDHREPLRAACAEDEAIWQLYPTNWGGRVFDATFETLLVGPPKRSGYAIMQDGTCLGMTAWIDADDARQTVEIGNSFIVPSARGSGVNGRIKTLMIDHAFAQGVRRIVFKIDERNARSQAAVLKLGAKKEGVMRAERITWTGHVRDTGLFSLLAPEWQAQVRAKEG
jgi:RimJ/RimL family protein N-acetyltransferase